MQLKNNIRNLMSDHDTKKAQHRSTKGAEVSKINTPAVELEMMPPALNKTTEQKYQELKVKYNDLLSKHFALAA